MIIQIDANIDKKRRKTEKIFQKIDENNRKQIKKTKQQKNQQKYERLIQKNSNGIAGIKGRGN